MSNIEHIEEQVEERQEVIDNELNDSNSTIELLDLSFMSLISEEDEIPNLQKLLPIESNINVDARNL